MDFDRVREIVSRFFNGQYEVRKFLGEGSFSEVYLVKHKFLDDSRAMKIIKEPVSDSTNTKDIFKEVQIATQLRHENIISIYDAGIITGSDNLAYFVMEYVPGGDLEQYLNSFAKSGISMPINIALNLMRQIVRGLNVLHSSSPPIVHRDLKLNNILLNYNACGDIVIKISDFGFSKEVTTGISDVDVVGTRPYMAPECFNKNYSQMTDIYAVGVIFYQLLTSHYPYGSDRFSIDDLMALKPWKSDLKRPSHYNKNVSKKLDEIVAKCLEFDFKKRYRNAGELLSDIELLIDEAQYAPEFNQSRIENGYVDDYSDYILNDSIVKAFELAKTENGLDEAIELLEREVLGDYDIRRYYGETLRMWKSKRPDVKLISKAFTVTLRGKNYLLACDLLREAIACNPSLKSKYLPYIELWNVFIDLTNDNNLVKAVISLEELMRSKTEIYEIYANAINILKTFDLDRIVSKSIRLVKMNNLVDAANLMEFAVVCDHDLRRKYEYKLSLWKQNLEVYYKNGDESAGETIDYAIDLGTADSIVSHYNNGQPVIVKNHITGEDTTPSAVLVSNDEVHVGKKAREAIIERKSNAVTRFKENMGFPIPFKINDSEKTFLPEELSAEVLKDLRVSAYMQCGVNMDHAAICIPANSNPLQTRAIRDACELAGFQSYNLIFEPIAVAMAYGLKAEENSNGLWIVYDLGGSTFKASLIRDNGKAIEQVATLGIDDFGGNTLDWKLVDEVFVAKIAEDLDLDDFNRENHKYDDAFSKLKKASESAKIELSSLDEAQICIPNLLNDYDFTYALTRDEFKKQIEPMIENTFTLLRYLMDDNGIELGDVDKVILVGGSCLSPAVKELISNEFELPIEDGIDPLTVVARGAAIYAGRLKKPQAGRKIDSVSLLLNRNGDELSGRVFSLDEKFSFLGFDIVFSNPNTNITMPLSLDGSFKAHLDDDAYYINVRNGDELIEIDEKSPSRVGRDEIYIAFFNRYFSFSEAISYEYGDLVDVIGYLNEYEMFDDWEILNYAEGLAKMGEESTNQRNIYINHLSDIVSASMNDLEFSLLLDNVQNKINILNEDIELDGIVESKDFNRLCEVHERLVEEYVSSNRNRVICELFFNLRDYGIYTENQQISQNIIDDAISALEDSDYARLFDCVNELYKLDERRYHGR